MKRMSMGAFKEQWPRGRAPKIDLSPYEDLPFNCVCGGKHAFRDVLALSEYFRMRLLLSCPEGEGHTLVRIKGLLRIRLISEVGIPLEDP